MPTVRDDVYDTVYRISQGDLGLLQEKTDDFLQSIADTYQPKPVEDVNSQEAESEPSPK